MAIYLNAQQQAYMQTFGVEVTPEQVRDASKDPENPLHEKFLWGDESKAANLWRLDVARECLRYRIVGQQVYTTDAAPIYVRNPDKKTSESGYVSVFALRSDPLRARRTTLLEIANAEAAMRRARLVASVLGTDDLILDVLDKFSALRAHLVDDEEHASASVVVAEDTDGSPSVVTA